MTPRPGRKPLGATPSGARTEFRVWAPRARRVDLLIAADRRTLPLAPEGDGSFGASFEVGAGTDYFYRLDGIVRPDPRSRHQPVGVHGPSRVVDPAAFAWTDSEWRGVPNEPLVFYELHVGTFTAEGTFDAAIGKLAYLRDLGIGAVQLMPVAEFPGSRNWGYDVVFPFAPHSTYGGPDGLKRLVDACHGAGISVFVDVVLNHLGPEGNALDEYAPYFTTRYRTPWGPAFDFESEDVRRYVIDAARAWIAEYHVDGLRLDAVHTMHDGSDEHIVAEIARRCRALGSELGRSVRVVAESDLNDAKVVRPAAERGWDLDAQWSDDFHHALYALVAADNPGHLADFGAIGELAKALTDGFVFDGRYSPRRKRYHGAPTTGVDGERFVVFAQNHDQIANVSTGRRLSELLSMQEQRAVAMILCVAPYQLLVFQGQEYGERARFHYFTSHTDPDLAERVRRARHAEYAAIMERHGQRFEDPQDPMTFVRSKLVWGSAEQPDARALRELYRTLFALRARVRCLGNCRRDLTRVAFDEAERWLRVERSDPDGTSAVLAVNFASHASVVPLLRGTETVALRLSTLDEGETTDQDVSRQPGPVVRLRPREAVLFCNR